MFKHLIIYRIAPLFVPGLYEIEAALAKASFTECGATQERSCGWVPPRGEANGALVEPVGGQFIARFKTESKIIPGQVLARKVAEKAARIEQETGRKPGRKETKELKEEADLRFAPDRAWIEGYAAASKNNLVETPKSLDAEKKLRTDVARAIWEVIREYEDNCDLALEDLNSSHQVWLCADAAIAAQQGGANG